MRMREPSPSVTDEANGGARPSSPERLIASMNAARFQTERAARNSTENAGEHVSSFGNQRPISTVPQSRIRSPSRPDSREAAPDAQEKPESMHDYVNLLPKEFAEELLDQRFDNPLSVSILVHSGPLTLLIFNRSLDLSHRYSEFRDIRMYPMSSATRNDLALQLARKLATFVFFTLQMAQKDLMHQWRIQKLFMHVLPTSSEVKAALKQAMKIEGTKLIDNELIMWKTVLEMLEYVELRKRGNKDLLRFIYPCLQRVITRGGDKLLAETRRMLHGCLAVDGTKLIICGQSTDHCLSIVKEKEMQLRTITSSNLHRVSSSSRGSHHVYDKAAVGKTGGGGNDLPLDLSCGSPVRLQRKIEISSQQQTKGK